MQDFIGELGRVNRGCGVGESPPHVGQGQGDQGGGPHHPRLGKPEGQDSR